jgi:hypothetical protein
MSYLPVDLFQLVMRGDQLAGNPDSDVLIVQLVDTHNLRLRCSNGFCSILVLLRWTCFRARTGYFPGCLLEIVQKLLNVV